MTSERPQDIESTVLFGVPVYRRRFPEFASRRQALADYVLGLRERDQGVVRSNYRGWHSQEDLHLTHQEGMRWLLDGVSAVARTCIAAFEGARPHGEAKMTAAWAVVNERGAWNMPHMHLPADWSGVFYISLGDLREAPPRQSEDGCILFFDPLPLGERFKRPSTVTVWPEEGMMLLFPGYVQHMVTPYYGESPRIAVSFNFLVVRD